MITCVKTEIPNEVKEQINNFKNIRKNYFIYYEQWQLKDIERKKLDENQRSITSSTVFTINEVLELSKTIHIVDIEEKKNYYSVMLESPSPYRFINFDGTHYRIYDYDVKSKPKILEPIISSEERYKKMFQDCVTLIYNLNIQIYNIEVKKLSGFNPTIFIFHGIISDIQCEFKCFESPDYKQGCLVVTNTINKNQSINHHLYFDLAVKRDHDYDYKKFIAVIHGISIYDFKQALYQHFINLPELLADHYDKVYLVDNYFKDNEDEIEDYKMLIQIGPLFYPKQCVLTPISHDTIYITKDEYNRYSKKEYYEITYKNENDFNNLIQYVNSFMNRQYGYGYKNNGLHLNEINFINMFPSLKVDIAKDIDNLSGFDLYTVIGGYQENPDAIMSFISMPIHGQSCILDYYGIRFLYDKRIDPLNCILCIDCKMCDLSTLTYDIHYVKYHQALKSFYSFKIHDSYYHCVKVIKELIALLN